METSSQIQVRFSNTTGHFDMRTGKLIPVKRRKYSSVEICFEGQWNIPFAEIKLYDKDLICDAEAVFADAYRLAQEICNRWNAKTDQEP